MPGSRLNDTERRLHEWWQHGQNRRFAKLSEITIKSNVGLRGIRDLKVKFDYPLTCIAGRNGCGKSTVLALAALAFHSPNGHHPVNAIRRPKVGENKTYYTFRDFFFQGPHDPDVTGVQIGWHYHQPAQPLTQSQPTSVIIRKRSEKWMHYERRPQRPVHYLGVARNVPAIEQAVLRSQFQHCKPTMSSKPLSDSFRARLAEIMGRPYSDAGVIPSTNHRYSIRKCSSDAMYSSFNMGAGEDAAIVLLNLFEETPDESLVVIEEIEQGLHPEAVRNLACHLQEIICHKKLQVIVSTHSEHFLDAVPRVARVLLERSGDIHRVLPSVTTRFALGSMTGEYQPELKIYCEDSFAAALIREAMTVEMRRRSNIVTVGSREALINQAKAHQIATPRLRALVIFDGDARNISGLGLDPVKTASLPGRSTPERWLLDQLDSQVGLASLAQRLDIENEQAHQLLIKLKSCRDPHDIAFEVAKFTGYGEDQARTELARAVARLPEAPLANVAAVIEECLGAPSVADSVAAS